MRKPESADGEPTLPPDPLGSPRPRTDRQPVVRGYGPVESPAQRPLRFFLSLAALVLVLAAIAVLVAGFFGGMLLAH